MGMHSYPWNFHNLSIRIREDCRMPWGLLEICGSFCENRFEFSKSRRRWQLWRQVKRTSSPSYACKVAKKLVLIWFMKCSMKDILVWVDIWIRKKKASSPCQFCLAGIFKYLTVTGMPKTRGWMAWCHQKEETEREGESQILRAVKPRNGKHCFKTGKGDTLKADLWI